MLRIYLFSITKVRGFKPEIMNYELRITNYFGHSHNNAEGSAFGYASRSNW
jgi:hypothetical protein